MSEFHFGVGGGRITQAEIRRRNRAAEKHGATFVVATGNCTCGYGCRLDCCPNKKWWFSAPNRGEPFDSHVARAVEAELS